MRIEERQVPNLKAINIFLLVSFFCAYEFVLRVMVSPLTHELASDLVLNADGVGLLSSAFFLAYAPIQLAAGLIFCRFGAKKVLAFALSLCALAVFFFSFAQGFYFAFIMRCLMGLGAGFAFIGAYIMIGQWFSFAYLAFLYGLIQLLSCLGAAYGQFFLAHFVAVYSWRQMSLALGVLGLMFSLVFLLYLKEQPSIKRTKKAPEAGLVQMLMVLKEKRTWPIALYALFSWAPVAMFASLWGVIFLKLSWGETEAHAALYLSATWLGVGLVSPLVGFASRYIQNQKTSLLVFALLGFFISLFLLLTQPQSILIRWGLLFLLGVAASVQPLTFVLIQKVNQEALKPMAIAINNCGVMIGGALFLPLSSYAIKCAQVYVSRLNIATITTYQVGLLLMPLSFLLAFLTALYFIDNKLAHRELIHGLG